MKRKHYISTCPITSSTCTGIPVTQMKVIYSNGGSNYCYIEIGMNNTTPITSKNIRNIDITNSHQ